MKIHEVLPQLFEQYLGEPVKVQRGKEVTLELSERCSGVRMDYIEPIRYANKTMGHFFYTGENMSDKHEFCFIPEKEFRDLSQADIEKIIAEVSVEKNKKRRYTRKETSSVSA